MLVKPWWSFFFFLSPEAEIPSSFCHNKGDRDGKWKGSAPREGGEEKQKCIERGEGQIQRGQVEENQEGKSQVT